MTFESVLEYLIAALIGGLSTAFALGRWGGAREQSVTSLNKRLEALEPTLTRLGEAVTRIDTLLETVATTAERRAQQWHQTGQTVQVHAGRLDNLDETRRRHEARIDRHEERISALEQRRAVEAFGGSGKPPHGPGGRRGNE